MNESPIKDEIVSILFEKGENLTDNDVQRVDELFDELETSGDLWFTEIDELRSFADRVIGQVSIEPDSKLSQDGGS